MISKMELSLFKSLHLLHSSLFSNVYAIDSIKTVLSLCLEVKVVLLLQKHNLNLNNITNNLNNLKYESSLI